MNTLEAFVAALPKVELHVHLVGSASAETVLELARRHPDRGVPTSADRLREFYAFRDFPHFIAVYRAVSQLISEPADIAELVRGIGRNLAAQNVRYVELQVAPYPWQRAGMPDAVISEALTIGARDVLAQDGVRIAYIVDFPGHTAGDDAVGLTWPSGSCRWTCHRPPTCARGACRRSPSTRSGGWSRPECS